jgi:catechol-2,3-dioxygenase
MLEVEALDHVALAVRDVERSAAWYIETLGFKQLHPGIWNGVPVFVGNGLAAIALFPRKSRARKSKAQRSGILHFAFRTTREKFAAAQRELNARGISFEFQDHEISKSIYFRQL